MNVRELKLDTTASKFVDLTPAIRDFCRGVGDGLLSVFAPHATVGLAIMEIGSGSEADLRRRLPACCRVTTPSTGTGMDQRVMERTIYCPPCCRLHL